MGFFDEFCEILKTSFFQATVSILRKKYYTNKIVKKSLRKEKMETACKKKEDTLNKNLITIYMKSSYPFTMKKFLYFSFLRFL